MTATFDRVEHSLNAFTRGGANVSRYATPFFLPPHRDAVLDCIPSYLGSGAKYPPIASDAFRKQQLKEIGLS